MALLSTARGCTLPARRFPYKMQHLHRTFSTGAPPQPDSVASTANIDSPSFSPSSSFSATVPDTSLNSRSTENNKFINKSNRASVWDAPTVRRPSDIVAVDHLVKNWWSVPATGFNSVLQIPVHRFEVFEDSNQKTIEGRGINQNIEESSQNIQNNNPRELTSSSGLIISRDLDSVTHELRLPPDVFGEPLRKDLIFKSYWYYRKALAGWDSTMQFNQFEWPAKNKKWRSQIRSGKARMNRRTAGNMFEGSFIHPIRPKDHRQKLNRRILWKATKALLSAKFAQNEIIVVDNFNLQSIKPNTWSSASEGWSARSVTQLFACTTKTD